MCVIHTKLVLELYETCFLVSMHFCMRYDPLSRVSYNLGTHVKLKGDVIHMEDFNARALHEMCIMLLQSSKDSNAPPKPCALPGALFLHAHCHNLGVLKSTPCLHANKHPSYLMLSRAQCPPMKCQMLLLQCKAFSKQATSSMWPACRISPSCLKIFNTLRKNVV
jgi:hypothetical protein